MLMQANYRGRRARKSADEVYMALAEMIEERYAQVEEAVAARVQCLIRGRGARKRLAAFREEVNQRRRDELISVVKMQNMYRMHMARWEAIEAKRQREIWYHSVLECTVLVQAYLRRAIAYRVARRARKARLQLYLLHRDTARLIQKAFNG